MKSLSTRATSLIKITFLCWIVAESLQYYIYFRWLFHGSKSSCSILRNLLKKKQIFDFGRIRLNELSNGSSLFTFIKKIFRIQKIA